MGKLDHVKDSVVKCLAVGEPQTSIAEQIGVDQSTVSRFASKSEIRKLIEVEKEKLVKVLPDAVQNVKDLVEEMKDIPKDDTKRRELSYKASKDVLKATNVFPSPQYAHNIYNDNRQQQNTVLSATVAMALGQDVMRQLEKLSEEGVD
jgi:DNA-binding transcriptional MocR family regulator